MSIPTKGSLLKKVNFETVKYESYKSKKKGHLNNGISNDQKHKQQNENNEFDIKKARNEVIKFGTSGFSSDKKEEVRMQQAIKLGAKPPKNKYKNYKHLLLEKKQEKQKINAEQSFQQLGKNSMGKAIAKGKSFDRKRKKKANNAILDVYGKVLKEAIKINKK